MIDVAEVRVALTARRVLDYYQHPTRRGGRDELESSACPRRADHSRRAFTVNVNTGLWRCYPCAIQGDAISLVAEFERLDPRKAFPTVLARAAEIAGVVAQDIPDAERERRRQAWRAERVRAEAAAAAQRARRDAEAIPTATRYWASCAHENARGAEYLAERGLADAARIVRYDHGSPAIPLHTSRGDVRNVVRRRLPELGEPKTPGLRDCPTAGTLLGHLDEIRPGSTVVATEGVADTITAALAWTDGVILGAHGACNLPAVARAAAVRAASVRARLVLAPHDDATGRSAAIEAAHAAIDAGLSLRDGSLIVIKHGEKDLNDAWRNGWRPA
jgi:DNA primase